MRKYVVAYARCIITLNEYWNFAKPSLSLSLFSRCPLCQLSIAIISPHRIGMDFGLWRIKIIIDHSRSFRSIYYHRRFRSSASRTVYTAALQLFCIVFYDIFCIWHNFESSFTLARCRCVEVNTIYYMQSNESFSFEFVVNQSHSWVRCARLCVCSSERLSKRHFFFGARILYFFSCSFRSAVLSLCTFVEEKAINWIVYHLRICWCCRRYFQRTTICDDDGDEMPFAISSHYLMFRFRCMCGMSEFIKN